MNKRELTVKEKEFLNDYKESYKAYVYYRLAVVAGRDTQPELTIAAKELKGLKDGFNISGGLKTLMKSLEIDIISDVITLLENEHKNVGRGGISDGYHTFSELYYHRTVLFAVLCNSYPERAWKAKHHAEGDMPMFEGFFIVGINTPEGQYNYHVSMEHWHMFHEIVEVPTAPRWDGHRPSDISRLASLLCSQTEQEAKKVILNRLSADELTSMVNGFYRLGKFKV